MFKNASLVVKLSILLPECHRKEAYGFGNMTDKRLSNRSESFKINESSVLLLLGFSERHMSMLFVWIWLE